VAPGVGARAVAATRTTWPTTCRAPGSSGARRACSRASAKRLGTTTASAFAAMRRCHSASAAA
jgi:hypothetical protein